MLLGSYVSCLFSSEQEARNIRGAWKCKANCFIFWACGLLAEAPPFLHSGPPCSVSDKKR